MSKGIKKPLGNNVSDQGLNENEGVTDRKKRISVAEEGLGQQQSSLFIPEHAKDPDYAYRWCRDEGYSIQRRLNQGYEFPPSSDFDRIQENFAFDGLSEGSGTDGSRIIRQDSGCDDRGKNRITVLMRINRQRLEEVNKAVKRKNEQIQEMLGRNITFGDE